MGKRTSKRKARANSLSGLWKRLHELAPPYLDSLPKVEQNVDLDVGKLIKEVNSSQIPRIVEENFIRPYFEKVEISVEFGPDDNGVYGNFATRMDEENRRFTIDPIGLHKFSCKFKLSDDSGKKREKRKAFPGYRWEAFLMEIEKLPEPYLLFIAVLREVALFKNVMRAENKNGTVYEQDKDRFQYHATLWALKQLEVFYLRIQNRNLRSDYGIVWHEGEWIEDTRGEA